MRSMYVLAAMAITATAYAELDLSAFDGAPVHAVAVDLSAFDADCMVDLTAFDVPPVLLDLSAFDADMRPAVKPSREALDYPKRSSNWTHPGNTKEGLIDHLLQHPNHGGKFAPEMLQSLDYRELESLHSDDHEGQVKTVQLAQINSSPATSRTSPGSVPVVRSQPNSPLAAVTCPNGRCPVRVSSTPVMALSMKLTSHAPQPVYYLQQSPGGVCPTPQRRGLFGLLKGRN
jgi:hypothetical protein